MISWMVLSFVLLLFCCDSLVPEALAAGSCCEVLAVCYGTLEAVAVFADELIDVLIFCYEFAADF